MIEITAISVTKGVFLLKIAVFFRLSCRNETTHRDKSLQLVLDDTTCPGIG